MRVTVYLPPNLVGLKMSVWTVAYAGKRSGHVVVVGE
jgi:hypothetical protein